MGAASALAALVVMDKTLAKRINKHSRMKSKILIKLIKLIIIIIFYFENPVGE